MKFIRVVIVDDEPAAIDVIKEFISQLAPDLEIVGISTNGIEAIQTLIKYKPELVFLDVDMPLMNGIEVLEKLSYKDYKVIFTTGTSSFALKAIKLEAIDYLLKPIDPIDFIMAIEKVRAKREISQDRIGERRLQIPTQHGILYLKESNITHIVGMGSYCHIITLDKKEKIIISKNIGQLEERLSENFFRCHNSHIVNLDFVYSFSSKDGYTLLLKNGITVEVSRRNKEKLLERLAFKAG